ncbi:MAG: hypothetical protein PF636_10125 [Actinomycetota bacterium]|jgi:hypothetical protein|nr:hypothetical protein [Actinomycetota bacterium]
MVKRMYFTELVDGEPLPDGAVPLVPHISLDLTESEACGQYQEEDPSPPSSLCAVWVDTTDDRHAKLAESHDDMGAM